MADHAEPDSRRRQAIMMTDVVGYSALVQEDEARALALLDEHRELLRPLFPRHDGREIKTIGDAFLVEFDSTLQAVRCALRMQGLLAARNATVPPERCLRIRIGINVGEVQHREADILGDGVNIASRIEPFAEPGGICVTRPVYEAVRTRVDVDWVPLGERALKNIAEPVELFQGRLPWRNCPHEEHAQPRPDEDSDKSIAVLPFTNRSPDPENEFFSDGITEELIDALAKIDGLRVTSRTSAFAMKDRGRPLREIGRELDVAYILEGSVRQAEDRVRVSARLVRVDDDTNLWSEQYDRRLKDIFAIQDEIARSIVEQLKGHLIEASDEPLVHQPTEDLDAYTAYLRGKHGLQERTLEGFDEAIEHFRRAIELDPNYAPAYAGLALAYGLLPDYGRTRPLEVLPQAKQAARQALALDDSLSEAHFAMAVIRQHDWNWPGAERAIRRAIERNPGHAEAHYYYGFHLMCLGKLEEAIARMRRALELDPLSLIINRNLGHAYLYARQHADAKRQLRRTLELDATFPYAHLFLGAVHLDEGRYEQAVDEFETEKDIASSKRSLADAYIGLARSRMGETDRAWAVLEELTDVAEEAYVSPYAIAVLEFELGERDEGFRWLEQACEERDPYLRFLKVWGYLNLPGSVVEDPRYDAILRKVGLIAESG